MILLGGVLLAWLVWVLILFSPHCRLLQALWREPVFVRPVVIVESDDWGPGPESDGVMLQRIATLLTNIRDADDRPAVMTLGVVLGQPDGQAILADDCRSYHRRTLDDPSYASVRSAMQQGCDEGVFTLQRHGLEHCWPESLLARARQSEDLRAWLADPAARSESLPSALQSRWVDAATLPSKPIRAGEVAAAVKDEGDTFQRLFGQRPEVAVPNTFVWTEQVERAWAADGVRCVVTCGRKFEGRDAKGGLMSPTEQIVNGEVGRGGVRYVVRDLYFEPIRGHRAEHVWQGVAERALLGRPALIEMHRESFVASPAVADTSVAELERALLGVLQRFPAVRFMGTAALAQAISASSSTLITRNVVVRISTFVRRLLAMPPVSRALKLSGLRFILPVILHLLPSKSLGVASLRG